jgi:hypothetical protein
LTATAGRLSLKAIDVPTTLEIITFMAESDPTNGASQQDLNSTRTKASTITSSYSAFSSLVKCSISKDRMWIVWRQPFIFSMTTYKSSKRGRDKLC